MPRNISQRLLVFKDLFVTARTDPASVDRSAADEYIKRADGFIKYVQSLMAESSDEPVPAAAVPE